MATLTLTLPKPHQRQNEIIRQARRFSVLCCGRRFGKSLFGVERVAHPLLGGKPVGWFAPTYRLLLDVWRLTKRILAPVVRSKSETEKRLELITGGVLDMWSLDNPDAGRGKKYSRVIIDEAAMVPKLEEAWQAAIRPTLSDLSGDAYFFSTPKGHGFFKNIFDYGRDPLRGDWVSWQFPTSDNPYIPPSEIEAARLELPERIFRQEYLAEFIDDAGVFRGVVECATAQQLDSKRGSHYVFGVDWGKHNDFTVISVIDIQSKTQVHLDRFNQIDYHVQAQRLTALAERFTPIQIIAESNAMGEPIIEQLHRQGLPVRPFVTTNASKTQAIEALALAFERREIAILNDPVQLAELQAYEMDRLPSGLVRYGAPDGMHDDTVMALAMAWHAAARPSATVGTYAS